MPSRTEFRARFAKTAALACPKMRLPGIDVQEFSSNPETTIARRSTNQKSALVRIIYIMLNIERTVANCSNTCPHHEILGMHC